MDLWLGDLRIGSLGFRSLALDAWLGILVWDLRLLDLWLEIVGLESWTWGPGIPRLGGPTGGILGEPSAPVSFARSSRTRVRTL